MYNGSKQLLIDEELIDAPTAARAAVVAISSYMVRHRGYNRGDVAENELVVCRGDKKIGWYNVTIHDRGFYITTRVSTSLATPRKSHLRVYKEGLGPYADTSKETPIPVSKEVVSS